jgi:hypothetical protein
MRALAGIDHDDAVAMRDRPRISRQPIGPIAIGENGEPSRQTMAAAFDLRGLDADGAGLNGVYFPSARNNGCCATPGTATWFAIPP